MSRLLFIRAGPADVGGTSSSTAEAASLSASLVRQGKALKTVSTESSRTRIRLSAHASFLKLKRPERGAHAACWCPTGLRGTRPPRCWSGDSESPGKGWGSERSDRVEGGSVGALCRSFLTISSSTLLDTATLKGWNRLMAEKAESSTSVCGSLRQRK